MRQNNKSTRRARALALMLASLMLLCLGLAGCKDNSDVPAFSGGQEYVPGEDGSSNAAPSSSAGPDSVSSEPVSEADPSSSESVSSEPEPQPAPVFLEGSPSASATAATATATFKTDVESTVNCILTTSGAGVNTAEFYNYFNRGQALSGAVSKKTVYSVTSGGGSVSFDIPDQSKAYYLLVNAVENLTGTWQSGVTVLTLYDPANAPPGFSGDITRGDDSGGNAVFTVKSNRLATVYAILSAGNAPAPTAAEVKAAGTGYGSGAKIYANASVNTSGDKAPYSGKLSISISGLEKGTYTCWFVLQQDAGPLSDVKKASITIS